VGGRHLKETGPNTSGPAGDTPAIGPVLSPPDRLGATKTERRNYLETQLDKAAEELQRANAEVDAFIDKRAKQRQVTHVREELWKVSVRDFRIKRDAEMRELWCEYHREQAERHRRTLEGLVEFHEERARELAEGTFKMTTDDERK